MPHDCSSPSVAEGIYAFDARGVARRFRHTAIIAALSSLVPGETMRFYNDHDPMPLLAQLDIHFGQRLQMAYVAREPGEVVIDFRIVA